MKTDFLLSTGASVSLYPADSIEQESYLIYLHGGGFVYGSPQGYSQTIDRIVS